MYLLVYLFLSCKKLMCKITEKVGVVLITMGEVIISTKNCKAY